MARCDRGYLCVVCGKEVSEMIESELYLRYVLKEVVWEDLDRYPERHLGCNPTFSQFIVADGYVTPVESGAFSKRGLDAEFVRGEEARVSRGYERLKEIHETGRPIWEYPIADEERVEPSGGLLRGVNG